MATKNKEAKGGGEESTKTVSSLLDRVSGKKLNLISSSKFQRWLHHVAAWFRSINLNCLLFE